MDTKQNTMKWQPAIIVVFILATSLSASAALYLGKKLKCSPRSLSVWKNQLFPSRPHSMLGCEGKVDGGAGGGNDSET